MNEDMTVKLHASLSRSKNAFHQAATAPLLHPSTLPHPALGHGGFDNGGATSQLATVAIATLQSGMEQLTMRVAKLESLFYVFESNQAKAGSVPHRLLTPQQDVRSLLHETMEPMRDQLRRHEHLLMDVVQSLNHAASWGYNYGKPPSPAHNHDQKQPAVSATTLGVVHQHRHNTSEDRRHDVDDARQQLHTAVDAVMVSPLTKADTSRTTTHATGGGQHHGLREHDEDDDVSDLCMQQRIARMRQLANHLHVVGGKYDAAVVASASKRRNGGDPTSSPSSPSHGSSSAATTTTHSTTTLTASSEAGPRHGRHGSTSGSTGDDITGRRHAVEGSGPSDEDPLFERNALLHSVKRILSKSAGAATTSASNDENTTSLDFAVGGDRHGEGGTVGEGFNSTGTPQRVRFAEHTTTATATPYHGQPHRFYPNDSSMFPSMIETDTTTTTSTSAAGLGGGVYHHGGSDGHRYRVGVQLLQSPGSIGGVGGGGGHQDTSSYSDGYQELMHRMRM